MEEYFVILQIHKWFFKSNDDEHECLYTKRVAIAMGNKAIKSSIHKDLYNKMAKLDPDDGNTAFLKVQQIFGVNNTHTYFKTFMLLLSTVRRHDQSMQEFINILLEMANKIRAHKPPIVSEESLGIQLVIMQTYALIYGMGKGYEHEQTTLENDVIMRNYDESESLVDVLVVYKHILDSVIGMETRQKESGRGKAAHAHITYERPVEACYRCLEKTHTHTDCPHIQARCKYQPCGKVDHIEKACKTKKKHLQQPPASSSQTPPNNQTNNTNNNHGYTQPTINYSQMMTPQQMMGNQWIHPQMLPRFFPPTHNPYSDQPPINPNTYTMQPPAQHDQCENENILLNHIKNKSDLA
eukprot:Awhi_evm1s4642